MVSKKPLKCLLYSLFSMMPSPVYSNKICSFSIYALIEPKRLICASPGPSGITSIDTFFDNNTCKTVSIADASHI